jgi:urease accessory protein
MAAVTAGMVIATTTMVMTTGMTMTTTTGMATSTEGEDRALLQLIWLASPALPVGGFSYSEGLEGAVDAGLITDEASAARWLVDQLHLTLSRSDLAVVAQAAAAWRAGDTERVQALNAWVLNTRETRELRLQTEQMGRSFIEWLKSVHPEVAATALPLGHLTYPVAFARAASTGTAPVRAIALAFAFGWAENMMQAAIKSVPLGQSAGQRILARLAHEITQAVDHALTLDDASRQAFSPMLAILSSRHEHQYSRLFRS